MKAFSIFTVVFLLIGICSVAAQDMIILKDGNMIEAKVTEISKTEIRYKRFEHLDGPTIVIPSSSVLSIKYQNGTYEIINADAKSGQKNAQTEKIVTQDEESPKITAISTDKFLFAFNANAGSLLSYNGIVGPSLCIELGYNGWFSEINFLFPLYGGFGISITSNGFWHSKIGGFYLGGGLEFIFPLTNDGGWYYPLGLNSGYKFVTKSGIYFRTGIFAGVGLVYDHDLSVEFALKPNLTIGYFFK